MKMPSDAEIQAMSHEEFVELLKQAKASDAGRQVSADNPRAVRVPLEGTARVYFNAPKAD